MEFAIIKFAKHGAKELWWRGNSTSHWDLVPSVYRKGGWKYEETISVEFTRRAKTIHEKCPSENDVPGWRFLMQHYRLPTRLLDWSSSILIATFFSVNKYPSEDGAIWLLNPFALNEIFSNEYVVFDAAADVIEKLFIMHNIETVAAIAPSHIDIRMLIQASNFTIHGNNKPLNSYENSTKYLHKFKIPADRKSRIKKDLNRIGITESYLFPSLEHLAKELSDTKYD